MIFKAQITGILVWVAALAFGLVSQAAEPGRNDFKANGIRVVRIKPSEGDTKTIERRLQKGGKVFNAQEDQVHVVRIQVKQPPPTAELYALYAGDIPIKEYGSFPHGIFFKTYSNHDLQLIAGKPLRFVYRQEQIDLGVSVPERPRAGQNDKSEDLPDLRRALRE